MTDASSADFEVWFVAALMLVLDAAGLCVANGGEGELGAGIETEKQRTQKQQERGGGGDIDRERERRGGGEMMVSLPERNVEHAQHLPLPPSLSLSPSLSGLGLDKELISRDTVRWFRAYGLGSRV